MNSNHRWPIHPTQLLGFAWAHRYRLIVPIALCTFIALVHALWSAPVWEASQALLARDEAQSIVGRPGHFQHADDMKTAQETILELAKSDSVLRAALEQVGPPEDRRGSAPYPTSREVSALENDVRLAAPKGAEFGKTEVFYLKVQATSRERAMKLVSAICDQLQTRFQQLRNAKAESTVAELTGSVAMARRSLDDTTTRLTAIESKVGPDLGELRLLQDSPSADSALRRTIAEMENERRQAQASQQANYELLQLLKAAQADPKHLLATPNRLLESQPALRRLKDGLVDAELKSAQLLGQMSDKHPQARAALESEEVIRGQIRSEVESAVRGLDVETRLASARIVTLDQQIRTATARLQTLAALRADYGNLASESRHRTDILKTDEQQLADAQASLATSRAVSLISRIDQPSTSDDPVSMGKTKSVAAGFVAGLLIGCAALFLAIPIPHPSAGQHSAGDQRSAAATPAPYATSAQNKNGHDRANPQPIEALSLKQALKKLIPHDVLHH